MNGDERIVYQLAASDAVPPNSSSYWVVEGRLLAGAYPGAPEPHKHGQKIRSLLSAGIRAFVNLMQPDETNHQGQPFVPYLDVVQEFCPEAAGVRFPIRDLGVPSIQDMNSILNAIDGFLRDRKPVYVHCWGGVGRTGTVIGCWLLRHQLAAPEDFIRVLDALRQQDRERRHRVSPESAEQQRFVRQWLSNDTGRR